MVNMAIVQVKACWVNSKWITLSSLENKLQGTVALDEREIILLIWGVKGITEFKITQISQASTQQVHRH
jgi:helix-turn-helix protein